MNKNSFSLPRRNECLKRERVLHNWTQADLAGFLGTDGYTVNRWECGRTRPSLFFIQKLCDVFGKSADDLGLLHERSDVSSSQFPILWSVPYLPNPFFTGRSEFLEVLHDGLGVEHMSTSTQLCVLHGLGGIGKTQLALEYAYRYASEYRAVFWIGAETFEQILSDVLGIADLLQLPELKDADQQYIVATVRRWLTTHDRWLLVWDNLEDIGLLQRWLPLGMQGSILITTRRQALGTLTQGIDLTPMAREEAMLLMLRRAKKLEPKATYKHMRQFAISMPGEYKASSKLVDAIAGLPLALDQVGAYIEETGCSLTDYLRRYEQQRSSLLNRRGAFGEDHPCSVTETFVLASKQVERELRSAVDLLRVCALLGPDAIPEELFMTSAVHLGPTLEPLATDPSQLDQSIAVLRKLSLVQRHPMTHTLSIHRLVQAVLQERMSEQERIMWLRRVIAALNAIFPDVVSDTWKQCERLLPHVLVVVATLPDDGANRALAEVLQKAADYLREQVQYKQAEALYQRALRIGEQMQESGYLVPHVLNGMALLCAIQGKYVEAELLYKRALWAGKQMLGPMHFEVARSLNNLGGLYKTQGKYVEAEMLYQQAIFIIEQVLGTEHPNMGYSLVNLAEVCLEQGKYVQVEVFCEQALHLWKCKLGQEHSLIADALLVQAKLFMMQEKYERAELVYQQVLHIWEQTIGADHPQIAYPLNGLANLYVRQKKYQQAELLYQRALALRELHLGSHHPETAQILHDLAIFQHKLGRQSEAIIFSEQALKIRAQSLGDAHPKTVATQTHYLQLLQETGYIGTQSRQLLCISDVDDSENACFEQTVTLRPQELKRSQILSQLLAGTMSTEQAAELLGCTQRHLYRLKARYREEGADTLIHGNRRKSMPDM